jgi:dihydroorotate dehydrogenase
VYDWLRPLFFRLEAERAHDATLRLLALAGAVPPARALLRRRFCLEAASLHTRAFGLDFSNPIGLAAGYDKDGRAVHGLACLGFGHLELGTVTPAAQQGNPRPRVFRLPEDEALINCMGFPNAGAEALLRRLLRGRPRQVVVGVNLGKGVETPLERADEDYLGLLRTFHPVADYLVVNVSSPNTIGLRRLQARAMLEGLLAQMAAERGSLDQGAGRHVPVLVKLAPDLEPQEIEDAVGAILASGLEGLIATNTTVARPGLRSARAAESGGLSGAPLRQRSTEVVRLAASLAGGRLAIIGSGGVFGVDDVLEKLDAGAQLVQVYTGLIYRGPGLVRALLEGLRR